MYQKTEYYHIYKKFDYIFSALADHTRRSILFSLVEKPLSVSEISQGYGLAQPTTSKHLKMLKRANLVTSEKLGRYHYFFIKPKTLHEAFSYFSYITSARERT